MSDTGDFFFNIQDIIDIGIVSPAYPVFKTKIFIDKTFFVNYLNNSNDFRNQIISTKEGGTRFALSVSKFKTIKVLLPTLEKQRYYSNIIDRINKKIELNEKHFKNLLNMKKYLLQQMFI